MFEADVARNSLTHSGVRVKIQDQPFRVLLVLLERPSEIVTREELRQALWPEGTYVDFEGSLNVILKKLRAAIDDDFDNPRFIETVPRRGYRFIAPVSMTAPERPSAPIATPPVLETPSVHDTTPKQAFESQAAPPPESVRSRSKPFYLIYAMCAAVIAVAAALFLRYEKQAKAQTSVSGANSGTPVQMRKSIAVLGFHNVSGRSDDAWLGTAFSEMLSTELAGGEKLRLVSGEDVANLRLSSPWSQSDSLDRGTASRIGSALGSDLLVLGSYTIIGGADRGQVRIDVRMQDAKTGEILTEIAEVGSGQDLFHIVERLGDKLRDRLEIPSLVGNDEAAVLASLPVDRQAARFYPRGLAKMREFDASAAKDLFEQASAADPKFSLVHLMLARAWNQLGYEQNRKEEVKKARDLSSDLSPAARLLVEGEYYESLADHEKAASTYSALFQMFPDSVEYGLLLASTQIAAGHASQASYTVSQLRALPMPASDDPRIDLTDMRATPQNGPDRLVLVRSALHKASEQGKKVIYAQARKDECQVLIYSDHPEEGPPACQEAYDIYIAAGNRLGAADAIRMMADYEGSQGHLDQAIATYQRALNILQTLGEHRKTGSVLNNMAINFTNEGKLDRAEELYREAKSHFEQAGDRALTATATGNIADILCVRGDLAGAAKMYQEVLAVEDSLDHGEPGYPLYRLSDVYLAQGRVREAHQLAQRAVDTIRPDKGAYQYLTGAMNMLGEVLKAEGDLSGARKQFEESLGILQKLGQGEGVAETQGELAELALDEGQPERVEPLLHSAIAEFEQEKATPDIVGAYVTLSRALLMQGKVEEARNAIQHATELGHDGSDSALKLSLAIQTARVEIAGRDKSLNLVAARTRLNAAITTAKKLGHYDLECEARLVRGQLEAKIDPQTARIQLTTLASDSRSHGFELMAHQAEQAVAFSATSTAADNRAVR